MQDAKGEYWQKELNKIFSREKKRDGDPMEKEKMGIAVGEHAGKRGGRKGIKSKGLPTLSNRV